MKKLLLIGSNDFIEKFIHIYEKRIDMFEVAKHVIDTKHPDKVLSQDVLSKNQKIIYLSKDISQDYYLLFNSLKESIEISYFFNLESINLKFKNNLYFGIPHLSENDIKKESFIVRLIETFFASIILLMISPILIIVSIFMIFTDGFPVFFIQERVGLDEKKFTIYKFRTLKNSTPKYMKSSNKTSDYYTKFGLFLRKSNIDELPQFFNVLNGTMSFIGPRPEMPFIVKDYNLIEKFRLKVKPGVSGLWQLSQAREREIHHNLEHDFKYMTNKSFLLDVKLFFQTAFKSFR
jgi:lipopolysaccharide/colanic/teichoic acid biosynthesis glycosyltransferase